MGLITPVTALPARNASPAGAITASGPTVRFYGTLTSGAITLTLIQRLSGGDWDFVKLPSGEVASVVADASVDGTNYLDVANLNAGTLYALYSSTPAPSSLRAYVTELTDPSAGQYSGPALSNVNPASVSATADVTYGAATTAARSDHVHDIGATALLIAVPIGTTTPAAGAFTTLSAATSVSLGAGVTVTGATGAGAMALGQMTGAFTFPTGNIAYTGAATKTITLAAQGAASLTSAAGLTLTGGAASALTTSAGALTLTSAAAATWSAAVGALSLDAAGGLNLKSGGATVVDVGVTGATSLTLAANCNLSGAAGTGAVSLGSMTGNCALPTGSVSWAGANTKTLSLVSTGAGITITGGAASAITTSAGALTITGAAASTWSTAAGALTITSAAAATWSTAAGALDIDAAAALNLGGSVATGVNIGRSGTLVTYASKQAAGAATNSIADPGNAGAIAVTADGVCNLVTAGAETRTLAIPTFVGQEILLCLDTDGGDCVITVASSFNQAGNTIITLNDAGDSVLLKARTVGGTRKWQLIVNDGAALS